MQQHEPSTRKQAGFSVIEVLLVALVIPALAVIGFMVYQRHKPNSAATNSTTTQPAQSVYAGWKTYTSTKEKASFKYPSNWTVSKPFIASDDTANTDQVGITSPSSAIKISWVTDLTGFGNEQGANYPLHTVIDKTPITGAPGYYVISGITTLDGSTYHPWLAVQDIQGILASGIRGDLITFTSRRALSPTTSKQTGMLFATSGSRTHENTPSLTKDQATAWFSDTEAQQAKQILLSFNDPPAYAASQYLTINEWHIKARPDNTFTLRYKIWPSNPNIADFTSDQLTAASSSPGCGIGLTPAGMPYNHGGGSIRRLKGNDLLYAPEIATYTAEQFATDPKYAASRADITKVGDYYYFYYHEQGPCADTGFTQEQTENAVRYLLQTFQPE